MARYQEPETEMSNYYFDSINDVLEELNGFDNWDWGDDNMNFEGFCDFVFENHEREPYDSIQDGDEQIAALLAGYCVEYGGRLSDWAIRYNGDVERAAQKYGLNP